MHTLARGRASVEAGHGRGDAAFIEKKQPLQVDGSD
jgi:hypothetical protein